MSLFRWIHGVFFESQSTVDYVEPVDKKFTVVQVLENNNLPTVEIKEQNKNLEFSTQSEALIEGFDWETAPPGLDYWYSVYTKLKIRENEQDNHE